LVWVTKKRRGRPGGGRFEKREKKAQKLKRGEGLTVFPEKQKRGEIRERGRERGKFV